MLTETHWYILNHLLLIQKPLSYSFYDMSRFIIPIVTSILSNPTRPQPRRICTNVNCVIRMCGVDRYQTVYSYIVVYVYALLYLFSVHFIVFVSIVIVIVFIVRKIV